MKIKENAIKGWITTIVGTATMVLTLTLIFTKVIDFIWEGIGGLAMGCLLVMAPRTIEKKVSEAIKYVGGRALPPDDTKPQD